DGIIPSRAQVATPPEHTRTASRPRCSSIRWSSTCAITLRAVLAWQTMRTVSATGIGQRPVVGMARGRPLAEHPAELRADGIDAAQGHGAPADREVVGRQLAGAGKVALRGLGAPAAEQPLAQPELRPGQLITGTRQRLERPDLLRGEGGNLSP